MALQKDSDSESCNSLITEPNLQALLARLGGPGPGGLECLTTHSRGGRQYEVSAEFRAEMTHLTWLILSYQHGVKQLTNFLTIE